MNVIDFNFRNEVLKHNASLSYCYQCSTCSGGCPVALLTKGEYNPRKIIEEAILGLEEKLIEKQEPNPFLCSTCQKCVELCPQNVELTEIFILIKNRCFEKGNVPHAFIMQGQAVIDFGIAIPYSKAIETRRKNLGLPIIKTAEIDEVKTIMRATNFENNLPKEAS